MYNPYNPHALVGWGQPYSPARGQTSIEGALEILGAQNGGNPNMPPPQHAIVEQAYSKGRGYMLPFPAATVTASTSADFTSQPQTPFRPESLIIQATSLTGLLVDQIRVGKDNQFIGTGSMPGSAFGATTTFKGFKGDTAWPGINVTVSVTDTSGTDNVVSLGMFGPAADA